MLVAETLKLHMMGVGYIFFDQYVVIAKGVEPDILRVQGCSTFEPVVQRAYGAGAQATNRRVEVEMTAQLVEEFQDRPSARELSIEPANVPAAARVLPQEPSAAISH